MLTVKNEKNKTIIIEIHLRVAVLIKLNKSINPV